MMKETVIWGLPAGQSDALHEMLMYAGGRLLSSTEIALVKSHASKDGWHSFRVVTMDMNAKPDFGKSLAI